MLFWNIAAWCKGTCLTPRALLAITFTCIICNSSDVFNANHMFPNPVALFTYPTTLYLSKLLHYTNSQHPKDTFMCGEYYWYTSQHDFASYCVSIWFRKLLYEFSSLISWLLLFLLLEIIPETNPSKNLCIHK